MLYSKTYLANMPPKATVYYMTNNVLKRRLTSLRKNEKGEEVEAIP